MPTRALAIATSNATSIAVTLAISVAVAVIVTVAASSPALAERTPERPAMSTEQPAPTPMPPRTPLPVAGGQALDALSLQAAPDGSVQLLVSARGETGPRVIRLYTLGADTAVLHREFVPPQVYPPQWAAVALGKDVLSMAVTKPGGASSHLLHWRSDQAAAAAMNSSDTFRVFKAPRAVRQHGGLIGSGGSGGSSGANGSNGPHRPPMFVAIERRAGTGIVTLFSAGADGQWTEQALFQGPAVADPVLAQLGAGWLLLYKTADGAGAAETTRSRQRGTAGPATLGQVHGLRLDAQFKATAPGFVLSSGPVYEFDADLAGERLVMLGTTPEGYRLTEWRLTPDGIVLERRAEAALPAAAGAPAVLLQARVVHLTVIESIGTAAGRVVHGQR